MPKKPTSGGALFVRLPADALHQLDRAAETLGMRKKDIVANLVSTLASQGGARAPSVPQGSYSFRPYERTPEVMSVEQTAEFLQIEESVVLELAEAGTLPGRKLGAAWRFSRAALVEWLATPTEGARPKR
jgi:excisionase family DNA binding protein